MKVFIELNYTAFTNAVIDLPKGKTWDDVDYFYVKWGTLYVFWKDDTEDQYDMGYIDVANIDTKRPDHMKVWEANDDGDINYDALLIDAAA